MRRAQAIAAAAAVGMLLGGCADESSPGESRASSTTSVTSTTSSEPTSSTADYKAEALEASRAWIEDDAGKATNENATAEAVAQQKQIDQVYEENGIEISGHDSVVSTEVRERQTNTTRVVIDVCSTTDKEALQDGENVRTDPKGNPVEPGDHQLQRVEMRREPGVDEWRVADSQVMEQSC